MTDDASVAGALATIDAAEGRLDVLIHNAGILETGLDGPAALRSFDTNAAGVVRVTEAALPLLRKSSNPNVVTISSSMGSFWAVTNPERPEHGMPLALEPGTTATDMTAAFDIGAARSRRARASSCAWRRATATGRRARSRTKRASCAGELVATARGRTGKLLETGPRASRAAGPWIADLYGLVVESVKVSVFA